MRICLSCSLDLIFPELLSRIANNRLISSLYGGIYTSQSFKECQWVSGATNANTFQEIFKCIKIHFLREFRILTVLNNGILPCWLHSPSTSIVYNKVVWSEVSSTLLKIPNILIKKPSFRMQFIVIHGTMHGSKLELSKNVPTWICAIMSSNVFFCATVNTYQ